MDPSKAKTFLILTISAGSGHLQAARAKSQEIKKLYPHAKIIHRDLLQDWSGRLIGTFCSTLWNRSQARGSLPSLGFIISGQWIFDRAMWLPLFLASLYCLLKNNVDYVIDTQPLGISSLLKAIRFIKFWFKKEITIEIIITDLPTRDTTHFFLPIRKLSKKDRTLLKIVTTTPLLNESESEQAFWQSVCHVTKDEITYAHFPVRASFLEYAGQARSLDEPLPLTITVSSPKELDLIEKITSYGSLPLSIYKKNIQLVIQPTDKLAIIMLGAYPNKDAILNYCKEFIEVISEKGYKNRRDLLFILCGDGTSNKYPLHEQILSYIKKIKNYPQTLTIIPVTHQGEGVIAPLFHRSDASFTRSGGLTSMEILCVCQGKVWIHKEKTPEKIPQFFLNRKTLQSGMPPWESGNARYLEAKKGARLVSPDTFKETCQAYFPPES